MDFMEKMELHNLLIVFIFIYQGLNNMPGVLADFYNQAENKTFQYVVITKVHKGVLSTKAIKSVNHQVSVGVLEHLDMCLYHAKKKGDQPWLQRSNCCSSSVILAPNKLKFTI